MLWFLAHHVIITIIKREDIGWMYNTNNGTWEENMVPWQLSSWISNTYEYLHPMEVKIFATDFRFQILWDHFRGEFLKMALHTHNDLCSRINIFLDLSLWLPTSSLFLLWKQRQTKMVKINPFGNISTSILIYYIINWEIIYLLNRFPNSQFSSKKKKKTLSSSQPGSRTFH